MLPRTHLTDRTLILVNSIVTPDGTRLYSRHRHDYRGYQDNNGRYYAVDGGLEYLKRNYDEPDYTEASLFYGDAHSEIRKHFLWGSSDGRTTLLKDLTDEHLDAIIRTQTHLKSYIHEQFLNEKQWRFEKAILKLIPLRSKL
jgi:hypothetical protein